MPETSPYVLGKDQPPESVWVSCFECWRLWKYEYQHKQNPAPWPLNSLEKACVALKHNTKVFPPPPPGTLPQNVSVSAYLEFFRTVFCLCSVQRPSSTAVEHLWQKSAPRESLVRVWGGREVLKLASPRYWVGNNSLFVGKILITSQTSVTCQWTAEDLSVIHSEVLCWSDNLSIPGQWSA